jgi:hypothetical protein
VCGPRTCRFVVGGLLLGLLVTGAPVRFLAEAGDAPEVGLRELRDAEGGMEAQAEVLEELRRLGGQGKDVRGELIDFIADREQSLELRCRGVLVLRDAGIEEVELAASLFEVLRDPGTEEELRRTILMAHGDRDEFASVLVPSLLSITGEKTGSLMLRRQALLILRDHLASEGVIEALTRLLLDESESLEIRTMVVELMNVPGMLPTETLEGLGEVALKGSEALVLRSRAIEVMAARGQDAASALPLLGRVVVDSEAPLPLRLRALRVLGQIGASGASAGGFLEVLLRMSEPVELRRELAKVIAEWEVSERRADWVKVLKQDEHPVEVRRLALETLGRVDDVGPEVIALSVGLMGDASEDVTVRLAAAELLRAHVVAAEDVRESLERILGDSGQPGALREKAGLLLAQASRSWLKAVGELTWESLAQRIQAVADARRLMERAGLNSTQSRQNIEEIRRVQEVLLAERRSRWLERGADWARRHRGLAAGILCFGLLGLVAVGLVGTWTVLSRRAPMTLWRLDQQMRRYDGRLPSWLGGRRIGPRHWLLLSSRRRELRGRRAWQRTVRPVIRARFKRLRAELGADPYVSVPVQVNGEFGEGELGVEPGGLFERAREGVVIGGEAGTGKTCLALELAWRWLAERAEGTEEASPLPIWMEERSAAPGGSFDWSEAVRGILNTWLPAGLVPSRETVETLLREGCLVPIVDGASEWPVEEGFWTALQRDGRDGMRFLLTTRRPEPWVGRVGVLCGLSRLQSHEASGILQTFLSRARGNSAVPVSEVLKTCRQWEIMTDGRAIPVEVVRWYAELVASETTRVPATLVELGELHVQRLHASGCFRLTGTELVSVVGAMAWTELQRGGSGRGLTLEEMKGEGVNRGDLAGLVEQLERQGLLERPGGGTYRFRHWWVKIYLAAGHLIRMHGQDGEAWRRFFRERQVEGCEAVALDEAILDGTSWRSDPLASPPIPAWVCDRLGERIGLEPARREGRLAAARARELASQVLTAEHPERAEVIQELAKMGAAAAGVVPMLSAALSDAGEDLEVRYGALIALGLLGRVSLAAWATLEAVSASHEEQLFLRIKALEVLAGLRDEEESTLRILVDRLRDAREPVQLRIRAGELILNMKHAEREVAVMMSGMEEGAERALDELMERLRGGRQKEVVNRV